MKRLFSLTVALAFLFTFAAPLHAALPRPVDKIKNGTMEVIKSPLELIDHTKKEVDSSKYKALGLVGGLAKAPFHMVKKAGHGIVEIATFPID